MKIVEKVQEAALEAAYTSGEVTKDQLMCMARDSGWVMHCNTVKDFKERLAADYPALAKAGSLVKDLQAAYCLGAAQGRERRKAAGAYRTKQEGDFNSTVGRDNSSVGDGGTGKKSRRVFDPVLHAELEEVPLSTD